VSRHSGRHSSRTVNASGMLACRSCPVPSRPPARRAPRPRREKSACPPAWIAIRKHTSKKDDVLGVPLSPSLAGIQEPSARPDLIPLCHHDGAVARRTSRSSSGQKRRWFDFEATVRDDRAPTGVEMEALNDGSGLALLTSTTGDLKSAENGMRIGSRSHDEKFRREQRHFKAREGSRRAQTAAELSALRRGQRVETGEERAWGKVGGKRECTAETGNGVG